MSNEPKQEEKPIRMGQVWLRGTVEDYAEFTRGSYTAKYLRVFVPNERNANFPDTYFIKVSDKAAEKMVAKVCDEVEVICYTSSRLNRAGDGAFPDFVLSFCKILRPDEKPAGAGSAGAGETKYTESGTREVAAPEVPGDDPCPF